MIRSNNPSSLRKKNEMNTMANKATKVLVTIEATEPTMPLTFPKSTNSLIFPMISAERSKSLPRLGKTPISHSFNMSMGFDSK